MFAFEAKTRSMGKNQVSRRIALVLLGIIVYAIASTESSYAEDQVAIVEPDVPAIDSQGEFPYPPDMTVEYCLSLPMQFGEDHNEVTNTFHLPVSSDKLFLFTKGVWWAQIGTINLLQSTEGSDLVSINITTTWGYPYPPHNTLKICQFRRDYNEHGVGILSVGDPLIEHIPNVQHHIDVILPASPSNEPLKIKGFDTDLIVFWHSFLYPSEKVIFGSVSFLGASFNSLSANHAIFRAYGGPIVGTFSVNSYLRLQSEGIGYGGINASIAMVNYLDQWTELEMSTKVDHEINANLSLYTSDGDPGGRYRISTRGSTRLNTTSAPINSTVDLTVNPGEFLADITMHETFEGHIHIDSIYQFRRKISTLDREDPEGRGRKRMFQGLASPKTFDGSVWWDREDDDSHGDGRGMIAIVPIVRDVILRL
ncbi:hypothetical protein VNI00_011868 [Paramarasmius palmivorus]|uniref:Uncharacterized protein n=1 Tax=Paramarasmius palmivorus TaxID=297713 RepID=A0AAW0C6J7_9AGAR